MFGCSDINAYLNEITETTINEDIATEIFYDYIDMLEKEDYAGAAELIHPRQKGNDTTERIKEQLTAIRQEYSITLSDMKVENCHIGLNVIPEREEFAELKGYCDKNREISFQAGVKYIDGKFGMYYIEFDNGSKYMVLE